MQQKYDVKHLNGFIPAMYFVHINTRRVSRLGGMKTSRPVQAGSYKQALNIYLYNQHSGYPHYRLYIPIVHSLALGCIDLEVWVKQSIITPMQGRENFSTECCGSTE
jgi:hypothetical protein